MGVELGKIWPMISELVKDGISLIPVREEAECGRPAKTPYGSWAEYQQRVADEGELWVIMEQKNTTAIAAVCGAVSGNLECIDIDSKYYPGIDAILLSDINKFYPHLASRLRIHRTPSGGYHIIYRIADRAPQGNLKLAGRMKTDEELQADYSSGKRKPTKTVNFLETRGEGGYFLFPPSLGYTIHQNNPIPVITWEERCSLINLCQSYCEITKVAPSPKLTQTQESIYTTNPFEDFNNQCDPVQLMESQGWKFLRENTRFIWFTRPGKEDGVSASFNREKRVFYIFTSSTDLQEARGYNPATLFAEFTHNGDKKAAFRELVQGGFGQVKRNVEQSLVKKAVINGQSAVPPNFSEEAKEEFQRLQEQFAQMHPYGVFWKYDENHKMQISREDFLHVAKNLGFRSYKQAAIQINGKFVDRIDVMTFFDNMKDYIQEEEADVYKDICNAYEKFIQSSGKFIMDNRLERFDDSDCIYDTADCCYKFYNNVAIRITADTITKMDYADIDGLIWTDKMLSRNYLGDDVQPSQLFQTYLKNATGEEAGQVKDYIRNVIGYLSHDFKSESAGYIIVLQEMVSDPKKGGGSGKNIFGNILREMTTVCTVPGAMVQFNEKFLQAWNGQRVFFLADIPRKIDWSFLKEQTTGFGLLKKLYKNEEEIRPEDMPKILINTNFSYEDSDGGLRRRIRPVEFTDYYTRHGGVDAVHNKMFPSGFTKEDWKGFDDFVISSIQYHLQQGGKVELVELSNIGWDKKFSNQYGEKTLEFLKDNISHWLRMDFVEAGAFQRQYDEYVSGELKEKYKLSQKTLSNAVKEFCERHGLSLEHSQPKYIPNQGTKRVHIFEGVYEGAEVEDDGFPF
ncbi:bifunctional DNA primase/polymerase [Sphingobacterium sp. InxBP1]|uniref:bifunctional DNA primase/polymerase n=1 Tax=Sphingobacterium sp. InxBP1 TaxID=2870328 RepID=UPI002244C8CF|nr:bifunctional DNA primase/polymerase [Sphingobacterium sp. InxBP1]MCW8314191.1 bifunctional DNA primase/polymerase [Sphingobacterium sp. InxBP1]